MAFLTEFLMRGELGAIRFGMTIDEVRHLLGEPDGSMDAGKKPKYRLFKYGSLELLFRRKELVHATIYFEEPVSLRGEIGQLSRHAYLHDLEKDLKSAGADLRESKARSNDEIACYEVICGEAMAGGEVYVYATDTRLYSCSYCTGPGESGQSRGRQEAGEERR